MYENYSEIVDEYNLGRLLQALNDSCGNGKPLTLQQKQEIRRLVERLRVTKWTIAEKGCQRPTQTLADIQHKFYRR